MRKDSPDLVSMVSAVSRWWLAFSLSTLLLLNCPMAMGFDARGGEVAKVHEQITKDALSSSICEANLKVILLGCDSQDIASAGADRYRHFQDANLLKTLNFVEREKRKVLNFCATADSDEKSRACALYHFGQILHTLQDFYSRSNYLELKLNEIHRAHHDPTKEELYGLPLVDWSTLITKLRNGERTNITVEEADKSNPTDPESLRNINGISYFSLARELAVRETERQWRQLESLIKARLQNNATAVTISLKTAGCPQQVVSEIMDRSDELVPEL
jgi:hypothetical protein